MTIKYRFVSGKKEGGEKDEYYLPDGGWRQTIKITDEFADRFADLWAKGMYFVHYTSKSKKIKWESFEFHANANGSVYYTPMYCSIDETVRKSAGLRRMKKELADIITEQLGKEGLKDPKDCRVGYTLDTAFSELAWNRTIRQKLFANVKKHPLWKQLLKLALKRKKHEVVDAVAALARLKKVAANKGYKLVKA